MSETHAEERPLADRERRWLPTGQEEGTQKTPALLTP